jgi:hypothetical protein
MSEYDTAIVFTGHMIDLPERETPRFLPAMEPLAAEAIRARLADLRASAAHLLGKRRRARRWRCRSGGRRRRRGNPDRHESAARPAVSAFARWPGAR